ncbi:MAG: methyltransferase [Pseudomonadota bacterium]|nr:methyltransferase [Pseudomonadota bacterium]
MIERLNILRLGHRGDGIADTPGGAVYVPYTLPGETVEAEALPGHPDRRHLLRVEAPSPERIAPICPHFGICGGCAVQHWSERRYRAWKCDLVVHALALMRIDAEVDELIDAHGEGRRRAVLHARRGRHDIVEVGFTGLRAHNIVAIDHCPVLAPSMASAIPAAWAIAEALKAHGKPLDIHATGTDTGLDIDVRGSGPLDSAQTGALARLAENRRVARITRHGELVVQRAAPTIRMGPVSVALPPGAFLQATQKGEATLANLVADHAGKAKIIADLFSGIGPFALRLAPRARVTAVDNDAAALAALARAAAAPGLKPIEIDKRDLFRRPLSAQELDRFDAVIFDPPRQGADAQAREIARSKVPAVIAVSCNPATFARDARILLDGGYRLGTVTPVDQFRYAAHVEIVARFAK